MIDEFDQVRLKRRQAFLESRATSHLSIENDRQWHLSATATLLRDASAVALILGDIEGARGLLRKSGDLFLRLGFAGGFQLLYISGYLDSEQSSPTERFSRFARAFTDRTKPRERQPDPSEFLSHFDDESFRPPQLLRAYQALAGRRAEDEEWFGLRNAIRAALNVNAAMPVGSARTPLSTYLATFDQLAKRDPQATEAPPGGVLHVLSTLAQRRDELFVAARRDRVHWKALLRPAELIDFDLLALLLAGIRRGQASDVIATAFAGRDATTSLPQTLANALSN
jgi:hypothetical protein